MHALDTNAAILVVLPTIGLLASVVFRVDEYVFSSGSKPARPRRHFANFDSKANVMADPDGKVPQRMRLQRRELIRDRINSALQ